MSRPMNMSTERSATTRAADSAAARLIPSGASQRAVAAVDAEPLAPTFGLAVDSGRSADDGITHTGLFSLHGLVGTGSGSTASMMALGKGPRRAWLT